MEMPRYEYRFPSAATANALALKFNLDPDPISVCSDAGCRNDVGDISLLVQELTTSTDVLILPKELPLLGLYGALRASQALARV
ncbi:hypothetical protein PROFUN_16329 [Planoprotostelium fungivorum]|uniref:Uncharacterized protein n=1 Tax=Planoprotostelium fungivorum TaxID=1890364 RepID=A0A2P6MR41_9EUKA|nr:hypothetical protein PROFUN_16329 [Planoprotostelium fungivorum]